MRAIAKAFAAVLIGVLIPAPGRSQASFETAVIQPSDAGGRAQFKIGRGEIAIKGGTLHDLVLVAYQIRPFQIVGGPGWISTDHYDINWKAKDTPTSEEWMKTLPPMMQALLRDRFKLSVHRENRQMQVYSLAVAKDGLKLRHSNAGACPNFEWSRYAIPEEKRWSPGYCGAVETGPNIRLNHTLDAVGMSIAGGPDALIPVLARELERPVIDKTGLSGSFDIRLEWNREATTKAIAAGVTSGPSFEEESPSLFSAVEEQLGLKLASDKGPVEVIVIDHAERPQGN